MAWFGSSKVTKEVQVVVEPEGIAIIDEKIAEIDAATERLKAATKVAEKANAKAISVTKELQASIIRAEQLHRSLRQQR